MVLIGERGEIVEKRKFLVASFQTEHLGIFDDNGGEVEK